MEGPRPKKWGIDQTFRTPYYDSSHRKEGSRPDLGEAGLGRKRLRLLTRTKYRDTIRVPGCSHRELGTVLHTALCVAERNRAGLTRADPGRTRTRGGSKRCCSQGGARQAGCDCQHEERAGAALGNRSSRHTRRLDLGRAGMLAPRRCCTRESAWHVGARNQRCWKSRGAARRRVDPRHQTPNRLGTRDQRAWSLRAQRCSQSTPMCVAA